MLQTGATECVLLKLRVQLLLLDVPTVPWPTVSFEPLISAGLEPHADKEVAGPRQIAMPREVSP